MTERFRERLTRLLGRRPATMQIGALCLDGAGRVLLITSRGTGRWIIPKGWPMAGRSLSEAALQEAWEEAGVEGAVEPEPMGRYFYDKMHDSGFGVPVVVHVFRVSVSNLAEDFPEQGERRRAWFAPEDAAKLVAEDGLRELLSALPKPEAGGAVPQRALGADGN
ncbi:MAG: NUDIX hydrolase [Paracoccus sp. (in: a-proteobacteria)]|nr:NUDIX hydrolase [Paracoccus sp. (in: a-proteobacteria)]